MGRYFGALVMVAVLGSVAILGWGYVGHAADQSNINSYEINCIATVLCIFLLVPISIGLTLWTDTVSGPAAFTPM